MGNFNSIKRHRLVYGTKSELENSIQSIEQGLLVDEATGIISKFKLDFSESGNKYIFTEMSGLVASDQDLFHNDEAVGVPNGTIKKITSNIIDTTITCEVNYGGIQNFIGFGNLVIDKDTWGSIEGSGSEKIRILSLISDYKDGGPVLAIKMNGLSPIGMTFVFNNEKKIRFDNKSVFDGELDCYVQKINSNEANLFQPGVQVRVSIPGVAVIHTFVAIAGTWVHLTSEEKDTSINSNLLLANSGSGDMKFFGRGNIVVGRQHDINSDGSYISGNGNTVHRCYQTIVKGADNSIINSDATQVMGEENTVEDSKMAHVRGQSNSATDADYVTVSGVNLIAEGSNIRAMYGKNNSTIDAENFVFVIGNGTNEENRSNLFTIDTDGNVISYSLDPANIVHPKSFVTLEKLQTIIGSVSHFNDNNGSMKQNNTCQNIGDNSAAMGYKAKAQSFSERAHGGAPTEVAITAGATFDGTIETQRSEFVTSAYTINANAGRTREFIHTSIEENKRYGYCEATIFGQSVNGNQFVDKIVFAVDFADYSTTIVSTDTAINTFSSKPTYTLAKFTGVDGEGLVVEFDGVDSEEIMYTVNMDFTIIVRAKSLYDIFNVIINHGADGYAKLPGTAENISNGQPSQFEYTSESGWTGDLSESLAITREAIVAKLVETEDFFTAGVYDISLATGESSDVLAIYREDGLKVGQMVVLSGHPMSFALKGDEQYYIVSVKQSPDALFSVASTTATIVRRDDVITATEPIVGSISASVPSFTQDQNGVSDLTMTLDDADVPLSSGNASGLARGTYVLSYPTAIANQPAEYSYTVNTNFVIEPYTVSVAFPENFYVSISDNCEDHKLPVFISTQDDGTVTIEDEEGSYNATVSSDGDPTHCIQIYHYDGHKQIIGYCGWEGISGHQMEDATLTATFEHAHNWDSNTVMTTGYKSRVKAGSTSPIILAADARALDITKDGFILEGRNALDSLVYEFHAETTYESRHASYAPLRAMVKDGFTLVSSDPAIIEVNADNTFNAKGQSGETATLTATFTHPISGAVATQTIDVTIDTETASVAITNTTRGLVYAIIDSTDVDIYTNIVISDSNGIDHTDPIGFDPGAGYTLNAWNVAWSDDRIFRIGAPRYVADNRTHDGWIDLDLPGTEGWDGLPFAFEDYVATATLTKKTSGYLDSLEATLPDKTVDFTVHMDATDLTLTKDNSYIIHSDSAIDILTYHFYLADSDWTIDCFTDTKAFIRDGFTLSSSDSAVIEVQADNTIKAVGTGGQTATLTATFTHPITGKVAAQTIDLIIDLTAVSVVYETLILSMSDTGPTDFAMTITDDNGAEHTNYDSGEPYAISSYRKTNGFNINLNPRTIVEGAVVPGGISFNYSASSKDGLDDLNESIQVSPVLDPINSLEATLPIISISTLVYIDPSVCRISSVGGTAELGTPHDNVENFDVIEGTTAYDGLFYGFAGTLTINAVTAFVREGFVVTSSDEAVFTVDADNKISATGAVGTNATLTATYTHPVTGTVATETTVISIVAQPV